MRGVVGDVADVDRDATAGRDEQQHLVVVGLRQNELAAAEVRDRPRTGARILQSLRQGADVGMGPQPIETDPHPSPGLPAPVLAADHRRFTVHRHPPGQRRVAGRPADGVPTQQLGGGLSAHEAGGVAEHAEQMVDAARCRKGVVGLRARGSEAGRQPGGGGVGSGGHVGGPFRDGDGVVGGVGRGAHLASAGQSR